MFGFLKKSAVYTLDHLAGGFVGWMGWGTASGEAVTPLNAIDVTAVFCAARVLSEGAAQVPVRVIADEVVTGKDGSEMVRSTVQTDHWAHRLLAVKPNGWQTSFEFREGMVFCAALAGAAIAIKNVVGGEVRELLPVPPGSWSVEQLPDWSLRFRVDYADKTHGYFDLDDLFVLRGPSLNGYEGLPAIRQAREAIGLSKALEAQQAKLAGNGGKPSGVLSFKNPLAEATKAKLESTWTSKFGRGGEGGIAILDQDASFASMTMTSVDAQHIETRRLQIEEIGRAFRVHPLMLMQADKAATFASVEQLFRMHVTHTLAPWFTRFEQACERDILNHAPGLRVDLDERGLARGNLLDQAQFYTMALGAGGQPAFMTQNEVRHDLGLSPIDEPFANLLPRGAMNQEQARETPADG